MKISQPVTRCSPFYKYKRYFICSLPSPNPGSSLPLPPSLESRFKTTKQAKCRWKNMRAKIKSNVSTNNCCYFRDSQIIGHKPVVGAYWGLSISILPTFSKKGDPEINKPGKRRLHYPWDKASTAFAPGSLPFILVLLVLDVSLHANWTTRVIARLTRAKTNSHTETPQWWTDRASLLLTCLCQEGQDSFSSMLARQPHPMGWALQGHLTL